MSAKGRGIRWFRIVFACDVKHIWGPQHPDSLRHRPSRVPYSDQDRAQAYIEIIQGAVMRMLMAGI